MALIKCPECGNTVSDKAMSCPQCGCPIAADNGASTKVTIKFPVWEGQVFNTGCYILRGNTELASCKQGETVSFECTKSMTITVKMKGGFKSVDQTVNPGDKYVVDYKSGFGLPKLFMKKVDMIM